MAAFGNPPITAAPGCRSSIRNPLNRSVQSRSRLRIPISFMWRAAKALRAPIFRSVMAFTNPPTREKPGRTSVCATASKFPASQLILEIQIMCSLPSLDILMDRAKNAASIFPPTAVRIGRRSSPRMKTQVAIRSNSIPRIPTSRTPRCGPCARALGKTTTNTRRQTAAFSNPRTAARPGGRLRAGFRTM